MKDRVSMLMLLFPFALPACDQVKVAPAPDAGPILKAPPVKPPHLIEPKVWGDAGTGEAYEVRALPDGRPGLFDARGALLLHLMPQMLLDVSGTEKGRVPPTRAEFELVKLEPHDGGGFSLYGRFEDINGIYDLRVENGEGDPRVHVDVGAKWKRDVVAHRVIAAFRTGPFANAAALGHDYQWQEVDKEWVDAAHTPNLLTLGEGALNVIGRGGVEGVSARRLPDDRWDVELEMYQHENHPIGVGDACKDTDLMGVARFAAGESLGMRADFILGEMVVPLVARYPDAKKAAVALSATGEGGAARVYAAAQPGAEPTVRTEADTWSGPPKQMEQIPCEKGRFAYLGSKGFRSAWAAGAWAPEGDGGNALFASEVDARGVFAFRHPAAKSASGDQFTLFTVATAPPDSAKAWFSEASLAQLREARGLVPLRTDIDALLEADASPTSTVRDSLSAASNSVWIAPIDEVAQRFVALAEVDLDLLPEGVIRVRNPTTETLPGLTLLLPPNATARYNSDAVHTSTAGATYFDLPPRREQLVQLYAADKPLETLRPAHIVVVSEAP